MDLRIAGKTAIVSAATKGLGFATAKSLTEEGVRVAICGRNRERVDEAAKQIGGNTIGLVADVSDPGEARNFVLEASRKLGGLDILVCNTGGPPPNLPTKTDAAAYQSAIDLLLFSTITMCSTAIPYMQKNNWGRIVSISSHAVREPSQIIAASSVARTAASAYLKVLSNELAKEGITVNSIQPGAHRTDRLNELGVDLVEMAKTIPMGVIGDPGDFGQIAAFLCSDIAAFITGTSVLVDGGKFSGM